ncbi:MAG: N4-gp56 family major capsid protein [Candidatus Izemoplasmatales bacterium]|jgi:N4-gp56 family major capsid protein|nr:N4-gp56 family major capsid protein [Candidatus Izemoplasmatales bacterium]
MTTGYTSTTQVDPAVAIFYDRVLLKRALPYLHYNKFAQVRNIGKKSGNTVKWRRYTALAAATVPLTEGVTPPGQQGAKTDILAQISWYGDWMGVSDVIDLTVEDRVITEFTELLGEQMGLTLDQLTRDILCATASYTNASKGANGYTPTELTRADIDAVVKTLLGANASFITEVQKASTGIGTSPVRASFWSIIHTDLIDDLEACSGFKSVAEYPKGDAIEGEWGNVGNVRFLVSSVAHKVAGTPQAYNYYCLVLGKNAYGTSEIKGGSAKSIVHDFGSGGTGDPLNQRATVGWKTPFVARILNDALMNNLRVTHS